MNLNVASRSVVCQADQLCLICLNASLNSYGFICNQDYQITRFLWREPKIDHGFAQSFHRRVLLWVRLIVQELWDRMTVSQEDENDKEWVKIFSISALLLILGIHFFLGGGSASKFSLKNEQANILITQNKMLVFFFHLILHMTEWFRLICQNPIWIWAVVLRYQSKPFIFISLLYMHHDGSGRKIDKRSTSDKKQLVI